MAVGRGSLQRLSEAAKTEPQSADRKKSRQNPAKGEKISKKAEALAAEEGEISQSMENPDVKDAEIKETVTNKAARNKTVTSETLVSDRGSISRIVCVLPDYLL